MVLLLLSLAALASDPALSIDRNELFTGSGNCSMCHTGLKGPDGADISADTTWRGGLMANSATDPYWRATVASEVAELPALAGVIEDKCATCHTPMAAFTDHSADKEVALLGDGYLSAGHPLHGLALDGVSCTVCHQIQPQGLGEPSSFSGGYVIDTTRPGNQRELFGPNIIEQGPRQMMLAVSGYDSVQGKHLAQAGMCATCHTLYTPYVDASGAVAGEFPEQTPFLEYKASSWVGDQVCQDCHMPASELAGRPYLVHHFKGGNAWMSRVLGASGDSLDVSSTPEHFEASALATEAHLRTAAEVSLEGLSVSDGVLEGAVVITPLTGHKLPTAFPSRRVWVHLVVSDKKGAVVFESGAWQEDGTIAGNDHDADITTYEPHYTELSAADQVQIYEPILLDNRDGSVTTTLLRASSYLKDNRLLPRGMSKELAPADIAVHGKALEDADFQGGGDRLALAVPLSGKGPYAVKVELLYQSVGEQWARHIEGWDIPESRTFAELAARVPNRPVVLATAEGSAQ